MKRSSCAALASSVTLAAALASACSTSDADAPAPAPAVTFYRDVEPIVQVHCAGCHYEGGIGNVPFDAERARAFAPLMADRVEAREMPPWPPGPRSAPMHHEALATRRTGEPASSPSLVEPARVLAGRVPRSDNPGEVPRVPEGRLHRRPPVVLPAVSRSTARTW